MRIVAVEAIPFAIPYVKPLTFASGSVARADHVLVRVRTEDGVVGIAEAPPRPYTYGETQESIVAVIGGVFAPLIVGTSALARESRRVAMHRTVGNPTAKAAIDMAIWDVVGRSLGQGVSDLLGGYTDAMKVSHMLGLADPGAAVDEAARVTETYGITTYKVKVGRRPVEIDIAVCRALREAFGDTVELYIDGNRGWTPAEAARALHLMDDLDLTLAEEPCPADDILGRRRLVQQSRIPVVADESAAGLGEVTRELLAGSADAISIKTARTGFTDSQRILHACEGLGAEVVLGSQLDGQVGTGCAVAFGAAHAATSRRAGELSNFLDMADDLLTEPLEISGGRLEVPSGPGLGLTIDEDKLARYRTDAA